MKKPVLTTSDKLKDLIDNHVANESPSRAFYRPLSIKHISVTIAPESIYKIVDEETLVLVADRLRVPYYSRCGMKVTPIEDFIYRDIEDNEMKMHMPIPSKYKKVIVLDANVLDTESIEVLFGLYRHIILLGDMMINSNINNRFFIRDDNKFMIVDKNSDVPLDLRYFIKRTVDKTIAIESSSSASYKVDNIGLTESIDNDLLLSIVELMDSYQYTTCNNAYTAIYLTRLYRQIKFDTTSARLVVGDKLVSTFETTINTEHGHVIIPEYTQVEVLKILDTVDTIRFQEVEVKCTVADKVYIGTTNVNKAMLEAYYSMNTLDITSEGLSDGYLFGFGHTVTPSLLSIDSVDSVLLVLEGLDRIDLTLNPWIYSSIRNAKKVHILI